MRSKRLSILGGIIRKCRDTETLNETTGTTMVKQIVDNHSSINVTTLKELLKSYLNNQLKWNI